jgi:hypothetical protein
MQFTAGSLEILTDIVRINCRAVAAENVVDPSNLIVTGMNVWLFHITHFCAKLRKYL